MLSNVSVIMTIKNGSRFIRRSINSILCQTLLPSEIVIVDDGSLDDSVSIVSALAETSILPIKLVKTSGIGRANALNLAVKHSSYDWVANLDVDDYWLPTKLEKQLALFKFEADARIIITKSHIVHDDVSLNLRFNNSFSDEGRLSYDCLSSKDFYARNPVNHSSILFSKSLFYSVDGYNAFLNKQIDYDLWVRFLLSNNCFYRINIPLTVKVLHGEQSFEARDVFRYRVSSLIIKLSTLKKFKANKFFYIKAFFVFFVGFTPRRIKRIFRKNS